MNKIKTILLVWPIFLLLGIFLYYSYQRQQIDTKLLEADGLIWKSGEKQFLTHINPHEDGERLYIEIEVVDFEKNKIYKKTEVIDRDMFGGGFVRAAQVDQDSENEIIVWHAQGKYYLDFSQGAVREVSFDQVPQQVKDLADRWHKYNVMAGLETTLLLIFVFSYYILYIFAKGLLRLLNRKKEIVA